MANRATNSKIISTAARDSPMPSSQPQAASSSSTSTVSPPTGFRVSKPSTSSPSTLQDALINVWDKYIENTPQRVKLIDVFMAFLVVVGILQFVYCVIAGNYVCLVGRVS